MVVYRQNTKIWRDQHIGYIFWAQKPKTQVIVALISPCALKESKETFIICIIAFFLIPVLVRWQSEGQYRLTSLRKAISVNIINPYTWDTRRRVYKMNVFHSAKQPPWHYNLIREHWFENILEDSAAASSLTSIKKLRAVRSARYSE